MAQPSSQPCADWITADDVFDCGACASIAVGDQDATLAASVAEAASRILFLLSGRRYPGVCTDTVRPCKRSRRWGPGWLSARWEPSWGYCSCGAGTWTDCTCSHRGEITLGAYPVISITQVLIDGSVLAPSAYRLDDYRWLRRIDGDAWPSTQDLDEATTETDTWAVTYTWGRAAPEDGIIAAKRLACELYQACAGGDCALSKQAQSVARQGVEITFESAEELFGNGRTGLYEVDLFLETERYATAHQGSQTVSPDSLAVVRRAGT